MFDYDTLEEKDLALVGDVRLRRNARKGVESMCLGQEVMAPDRGMPEVALGAARAAPAAEEEAAAAEAAAADGAAGAPAGRVRIWAVSDIHVDMEENMAWLRALDPKDTADDVLILAGDVSNKWGHLQEAFELCKARYARVFFCAGNHDLWFSSLKAAEGALDKLRGILRLCADCGVDTAPCRVPTAAGEVLVVPLQSWHHPQWDTEPELEGWEGMVDVQRMMVDYHRTKWPHGVAISDGSAAKAVDDINDEIFDMEALIEQRRSSSLVVSFSHMLPRVELNPEKRYLTQPCLAKAVGSNYLRERVERLRPDVHVFGHTHFGYDIEVDGVRYIQAPLSYPTERFVRGTTTAVGDFPSTVPRPFLVWDSDTGWAPCGRGAWSEYSKRYGRRPDVTCVLPAYAAASLRQVGPGARVGWIEGRMPVWLFGPQPHRALECEQTASRVQAIVEGGAASGEGEPRLCEVEELRRLRDSGQCDIVDIRSVDLVRRSRIPGSLSLPHPWATTTFPTLPDAELLELCEGLMATAGPKVVVGMGPGTGDCRHAALLLAAFLRLRPSDLLILRGGLQAWVGQGGELEA